MVNDGFQVDRDPLAPLLGYERLQQTFDRRAGGHVIHRCLSAPHEMVVIRDGDALQGKQSLQKVENVLSGLADQPRS